MIRSYKPVDLPVDRTSGTFRDARKRLIVGQGAPKNANQLCKSSCLRLEIMRVSATDLASCFNRWARTRCGESGPQTSVCSHCQPVAESIIQPAGSGLHASLLLQVSLGVLPAVGDRRPDLAAQPSSLLQLSTPIEHAAHALDDSYLLRPSTVKHARRSARTTVPRSGPAALPSHSRLPWLRVYQG